MSRIICFVIQPDKIKSWWNQCVLNFFRWGLIFFYIFYQNYFFMFLLQLQSIKLDILTPKANCQRFQALYPPQLNVELKFNHKYSHYLRNEPFCSIFHKSLGQQATFKYTSLFLFFSPICEWTKCQCSQNIPNTICIFVFVLVSSEDMQTNCLINAPHPLLSALHGGYSPFG